MNMVLWDEHVAEIKLQPELAWLNLNAAQRKEIYSAICEEYSKQRIEESYDIEDTRIAYDVVFEAASENKLLATALVNTYPARLVKAESAGSGIKDLDLVYMTVRHDLLDKTSSGVRQSSYPN